MGDTTEKIILIMVTREDLFAAPFFYGNVDLDEEKLKESIENTNILYGLVSEDFDILHGSFDWLYGPVNRFVVEVMEEMEFYGPHSIFTSWLTATFKDNQVKSQDHMHMNSFMSGTLYLTENPSPLMFKNPLPWRFQNNESAMNITGKLASNKYVYQPQKGEIIMFPSHVWHQIQSNDSEDPRYSIAFNVLPTGTLGNWDSTVNLKVIK